MKIISVNIALPGIKRFGEYELVTAGDKSPVPFAMLRYGNFDGDRQADLVNHGGPDRSACVYAADHYRYWKSARGLELKPGSFCENLTIEGALESDICIGDTYKMGEALVQVTLPRSPCPKIDRINGQQHLVQWASESGRCGFHMRTLSEGLVHSGDEFELVKRHPEGITVAAVLDLLYDHSADRALMERLIALPEFAEEGRRELRKKLAKDHPS